MENYLCQGFDTAFDLSQEHLSGSTCYINHIIKGIIVRYVEFAKFTGRFITHVKLERICLLSDFRSVDNKFLSYSLTYNLQPLWKLDFVVSHYVGKQIVSNLVKLSIEKSKTWPELDKAKYR